MCLSTVLKKISDVTDGIVVKAVAVLIVSLIVTITLQILSRTLAQAYTWTEELSRYLLVWSTFLGSTMAYKRGMHISVSFLVDSLSGRARRAIVVFGHLLSIVFFGVAIWNGAALMIMQIFQLSPALQLPMRWIYLGIPLGFSIMLVHAAASVAVEFGPRSGEAIK